MGIDRWSRALSWHAALREADAKELTNSVGRQWQDWYADAQNRRVFDAVSRLLADRVLYRKRRRPRNAELADDSYDLSVPIAEWRRTRALQNTRKPGVSGRNQWWSLPGGIVVAAITALVVLWPQPLGSSWGAARAIYRTEVGGLKDVHLPDGSSVILGGRTSLSVAFSAQRRSVSVIEGQAWFHVAHDPHRPFVVTAGDGTITDIGTAFLVTRDSDRIVVAVTEGVVEVSGLQPTRPAFELGHGFVLRPALAPVRVSRGQQLTFTDAGALGPLRNTDAHAATAWVSGQLTFDDQPLRYVIETMNRYSMRHIVVSPLAGQLRFSGVVFDQGIGDWLQSLEVIFPVTVEEQGANVRIQMRYSASENSESPAKKQP